MSALEASPFHGISLYKLTFSSLLTLYFTTRQRHSHFQISLLARLGSIFCRWQKHCNGVGTCISQSNNDAATQWKCMTKRLRTILCVRPNPSTASQSAPCARSTCAISCRRQRRDATLCRRVLPPLETQHRRTIGYVRQCGQGLSLKKKQPKYASSVTTATLYKMPITYANSALHPSWIGKWVIFNVLHELWR